MSFSTINGLTINIHADVLKKMLEMMRETNPTRSWNNCGQIVLDVLSVNVKQVELVWIRTELERLVRQKTSPKIEFRIRETNQPDTVFVMEASETTDPERMCSNFEAMYKLAYGKSVSVRFQTLPGDY